MALPNFFVTGVAKILTGEQPCKLEMWLAGRRRLPKRAKGESSPELASYQIAHRRLLETETARLRKVGWKVRVESFLRVEGAQAILTGKPDIIAEKPDCRPLIVDVKGGQKKESALVQVALYMRLVPFAWHSPMMLFAGEVVHADERISVPPEFAAAFWPKATALVRELAGDRPPANPSASACKYCRARAEDCAERFKGAEAVPTTMEF